ncbi:MAG: MFS transporter [Spirochaetales bacterium]|nr:MFS transporter [Spirochaetales bacterium]
MNIKIKNNELFKSVLLISISIMFVISSTALLHANEAEFIIDRFKGITAFKFSLFDAVLYAAYLLAGPMAGYLSARTGKRKPFIVLGAAGTAVITLSMTLAPVYPILLILRFFQGVFCVTAWQSLMTMVLDLSDDSNRGRNMGIFGTFMALSMGLGPAAGGALAGISLFAPYYVSAVQCMVSVFITLFFIAEPPIKKENIKPGIADSIAFARNSPGLIIPALFNFVDRLHMSFIIFMIPLLLREFMQLGPEYRGMLLGINGSAYIILQYPMGRLSDKIGRYRLLVVGSMGYGLLLGCTGPAAAAGLTPLIILFFCLGIFSGITGPPNSALVGDLSSQEDNPLAMGFFNLFGNTGMVCGSLFGGFMLSFTGFTAAFMGAAAIELVTLALNMLIIRKLTAEKVNSLQKEDILV